MTSAQRSIGKMVSYGVTYGMGPFGLSQRLRIPVDQARTYIEGFFAAYPMIRTYLDGVVAQATEDGFTTTMLGRRRYLPELKARNPRVRGLGERQALNAPLQGSAADIMKLAMVKVDRALAGHAGTNGADGPRRAGLRGARRTTSAMSEGDPGADGERDRAEGAFDRRPGVGAELGRSQSLRRVTLHSTEASPNTPYPSLTVESGVSLVATIRSL